jgi:hypothetical protein
MAGGLFFASSYSLASLASFSFNNLACFSASLASSLRFFSSS